MKQKFSAIGLSIFLSFALLTLTGCAQTQESQQPQKVSLAATPAPVAGTRISLTPPEGFTPAAQFPGYQQESKNSSIMVTEIPGGPFSETSAAFTSSAKLAEKGMTFLEKQEVKPNGQESFLVKTSQNAYGAVFLKWHLILGDEKNTVIITATFPKPREAELSEKMKASLLTTVWNKNKDVSPTEGLIYSVEEKGDLKLAKRMSNALIYTKNAVFPSKDVNDPLFVVAQSISKTAIPDNEAYAKARVLQITQIKDTEIEKSEKVSIDNLDGYEIIAKGKDSKSSQPMMVYQVMLFETNSYYLIQGLVSDKNWQTNLESFKQMARTFRRGK